MYSREVQFIMDRFTARKKYMFGGVAVVAALNCLFQAAKYMYIYFVVFSPSHLMAGPVRTCNGECSGSSQIPKILHHTWKDGDVPERWRYTYNSCLEKHSDWKQMFWTDDEIQKFLEREYPWFMPTYHSYPYPIQRVDAMRYFLLYHFGGVYIDLDVGCNTSTDALLQGTEGYNVVLLEAVPTGVTNWFMASVPGHPLYKDAIEKLPHTNNWYGLPHATVMFSAGPMLLTRAASSNPQKEDVLVISLKQMYERHFWRTTGGSWHQRDEVMFKIIDDALIKMGNTAFRVVVMIILFLPIVAGGFYKLGNFGYHKKCKIYHSC